MDNAIQWAPRCGRWVNLVPVRTSHLDFLYQLAIDPIVGPRWRFGGVVPTYESFVQGLNSGVLVQFVVESRDESIPLGLVVAYGADLNSGFAHIGGIMDPQAVGTGVGIEAMEMFCEYLFTTYALRKLYLEAMEFNVPEFAAGYGKTLVEEGRLREHVHYAGRYWDRVILAVYRASFLADPGISRRRRRRANGLEASRVPQIEGG